MTPVFLVLSWVVCPFVCVAVRKSVCLLARLFVCLTIYFLFLHILIRNHADSFAWTWNGKLLLSAQPNQLQSNTDNTFLESDYLTSVSIKKQTFFKHQQKIVSTDYYILFSNNWK